VTGSGTIVLAHQDPPKRATAADRARNTVGVAPHNGTVHRNGAIEIASHPNLPRRPLSLLKLRFNRKKKGSAE